jgi:hypothetical protein
MVRPFRVDGGLFNGDDDDTVWDDTVWPIDFRRRESGLPRHGRIAAGHIAGNQGSSGPPDVEVAAGAGLLAVIL